MNIQSHFPLGLIGLISLHSTGFSRQECWSSLPYPSSVDHILCLLLSPEVCSDSYPLSQWCYLTISFWGPLLLLPSVFPSIKVFSSELALHIRWPKYWSFSFNIGPSKEYSELISFRIDKFDFLAVQGCLKSLLQHHNLKASILWHSAFFMVQLSHLYMTTGQTVALTIWTFVGKVMSLLLIHCLGLL